VAHDGHASAEELAAIVQRERPEIHLSTVYRTLEAFARAGITTHVHLGHGRAIYHLTDSISHHGLCERCGAVVHLPLELFDEVHSRVREQFGFEVDAHHFALVGRCAACSTGPPDEAHPGHGPTSRT